MNKFIVTSLAVLSLCACGGTGNVSLTTWGEEYIEQEIPASEFEDGFTVRYTKFLVVIKDFTLATRSGMAGPKQAAAQLVDVTKPGPIELEAFKDISAVKWDRVSYGIGPSSTLVGAGAVAPADVEAMKSSGNSVWIEGSVSKGAVTKTFSWKFNIDTHYADCTNPDFGEGVTVPTGGTETVQLTIHGDHFWYDDLQSPDAKVRGSAIVAADANNDGVITQAELAAVQLTSLPLGQYGTGGASSVKNLDDFVRSLGRTIGHFRGEGECEATAK